MTPSLKLLPSVSCGAVPSVTSTLPPPMSMTTAGRAADVDAVARGQVDEPGFFGAGDDLDPDAGAPVDLGDEVAAVVRFAGGAGRGRDDLVDLVRSARRLNFASVCSAAAMAVGVRLRPSRPPAPSRTMSFSRSMTSKDRSGRTCTTIMWMELVPMSMAAMRMQKSQAGVSG